jgi:hypothetical protein
MLLLPDGYISGKLGSVLAHLITFQLTTLALARWVGLSWLSAIIVNALFYGAGLFSGGTGFQSLLYAGESSFGLRDAGPIFFAALLVLLVKKHFIMPGRHNDWREAAALG